MRLPTTVLLAFLAMFLALAASSSSNYATATTRRLTYRSTPPAGEIIFINSLPIVKGIPYHSIIGDRGKGGNHDHTPPVSTDGIVPYWSSHLDGAESEMIVPSNHWSNRSPQGFAEVRRILLEHLHQAGIVLAPKTPNRSVTAFQ